MHVMISKDRSFPSPERVKGHRNRNRHIYPHHPGFHLSHESPGRCPVPRINRGAISILMFVDELESRSGIVDAHNTENRTKNFLSINPHRRPHVVEKTATEKKSLFDILKAQVTPVHDQSGPFSDSKVEIGRH